MADKTTAPYVFRRGERGIFAEVYFPKKVVHQGEIFRALREGLEESTTKDYLEQYVIEILQELSAYSELLDPRQYERQRQPKMPRSITREEAIERIGMYRSHFFGWSMYEVDGVFVGEKEPFSEERTQIIRLIFRLNSSFHEQAIAAGCYDVLVALVTWMLVDRGKIDSTLLWSRKQKENFLAFHAPWVQYKREFVDQYFEPVAKEVKKWIDDTGLFIFGYLVRRFWKSVIAEKGKEEEIWVTSFFNLGINVVQQIKAKGEK